MAMALSHVPPWLWRNQPELPPALSDASAPLSSNPTLGDELKIPRYAENMIMPCFWNDDMSSSLKHNSRRRSSKGGGPVRQQPKKEQMPARDKGEAAKIHRQRSGGSRRWLERQVDAEFDLVIVPADGCCMSGSESEDSDWSIGWFEPHSSDFSDSEENFAVIVPCYGPSSPKLVSAYKNGLFSSGDQQVPPGNTTLSRMSKRTSAVHKEQVEQWLSSLR